MDLLQGYVLALQRLGHSAVLVYTTGDDVRKRLWVIGKRRWDGYQIRNYPIALREAFVEGKMPLPELDLSGKTVYIIGW